MLVLMNVKLPWLNKSFLKRIHPFPKFFHMIFWSTQSTWQQFCSGGGKPLTKFKLIFTGSTAHISMFLYNFIWTWDEKPSTTNLALDQVLRNRSLPVYFFPLIGIVSLMMFDFQTWILAFFSPDKLNICLLPNLYWQFLSHRCDWEWASRPAAVLTEFRKATTRENRCQRVSRERARILGASLVKNDKGNGGHCWKAGYRGLWKPEEEEYQPCCILWLYCVSRLHI